MMYYPALNKLAMNLGSVHLIGLGTRNLGSKVKKTVGWELSSSLHLGRNLSLGGTPTPLLALLKDPKFHRTPSRTIGEAIAPFSVFFRTFFAMCCQKSWLNATRKYGMTSQSFR